MFFIILICTIVMILSFFYLILITIGKYILHDVVVNFKLKLSVCISFLVLFSLLTYGLVVVDNRIDTATVQNGVIDYSGTLGDLIGGVLNPIVALFGILAGGLAFYAQYKANKLIQDQFKIQQFESQFYEMVRLHKENVNELSLVKFLDMIESDSNSNNLNNEITGRLVFAEFTKIFETLLGYTKTLPIHDLTKKKFDDAYLIFFWGISYNHKVDNLFQNKLLGTGAYNNIGLGKFLNYVGVSHLVGHYFRHLFMTVKFVVQSDVIKDYEDKMKYLKILRAQLSNHEQIMLYYNWLAGYGS